MSKTSKPWLQVQRDLRVKPVMQGLIAGSTPLYVERYLLNTAERSVRGVNVVGLPVQLGGSRVQGGDVDKLRAFLPGEAMLVPAGCPTYWRYSGTIDFAIFYFPERVEGIQERIKHVTESIGKPAFVGDALVNASVQQIVHELHKGIGADRQFLALLARVLMEQTYRTVTGAAVGRINPRHVHFSRLQAVLTYIHEHLGEQLSAPVLAAKAEVSQAHFRRIFQEAVSMPPHRYVLNARLENARKLLSMTTLPISRIATECGFSSQSHLTARFRELHAATPAEYRAHAVRTAAS